MREEEKVIYLDQNPNYQAKMESPKGLNRDYFSSESRHESLNNIHIQKESVP